MQINIKFILTMLILSTYITNFVYANTNNYLNICTASNFLKTLKEIKIKFEKEYNCKIYISSDSTANIYTKIINGAPFDIFISADSKHINMLEKKNKTIYENYTYAIGKIIAIIKNKNMKITKNKEKNLATANPKLSPYGKAVQNFIKNTKLKIKNKIIYGCNINQINTFIKSNNIDIGFTSLSQIKNDTNKKYWIIPIYLYPQINQKIALLKESQNIFLAKKFIEYIKTDNIKNIIKKSGYDITKNE